MLSGEDSGGGNGEKLLVGHGELRPCQFSLGILEVVDVLGDSFRFLVKTDHLRREIDQFARVKASAVVFEMVKKCHCGDTVVEGAGVLEVLVPKFVDGIAEEFNRAAFGRFVGGKVAE